MSVNGSHSPSGSISEQQQQQKSKVLHEHRLSVDSDRSGSPIPTTTVNGHRSPTKADEDEDGNLDTVARLQKELDRTKEEKEQLASQYSNLLSKLTTMRTTLGNKLKQDAEELDRREQLVQQLSAQNDDLTSTVETLREELISSHQENERLSSEVDSMRSRAFQESAQESLLRERELREVQTELERCRVERDDWERVALQEKAISDESKSAVEMFKRDLELEREAREREATELEIEKEKANNLQSVLEDFQSAKEHELRQAVKDYELQLTQCTQSLAEFKHRALTAELKLEETESNSSRTQDLEREVREKKVLIDKLRHEAVIINEHLMEALRRLKRNSTETNVDRRLVTNILLSFLTTPRADPKRFEMLTLLATILSWNDAEREKAGLQRAGGMNSVVRSPSSGVSIKSPELQKTDETESFSRLWVEFLLTEASSGESTPQSVASPPPRTNSLPGSPGPPSPQKGTRRLVSLSSVASSPALSGKGKEKEKIMDS